MTAAARKPFSNSEAESIAKQADRLERQASQVRAQDKSLALSLMRTAAKLRKAARSIQVRDSRNARVRMARREARAKTKVEPEDKTEREWREFFAFTREHAG